MKACIAFQDNISYSRTFYSSIYLRYWLIPIDVKCHTLVYSSNWDAVFLWSDKLYAQNSLHQKCLLQYFQDPVYYKILKIPH